MRFKLQGGMGASRDDALFFLFPCPQNAMNELPPPPAPDADALSPDAVDVLLRRWNAQVKHLRADDRIPSHRFDLAVTDDQPFSAARLKSNIERCLIIVAKLKTCGREMARLRSWDDPGRTAAFCSVYFLAWFSPIGVAHALVVTLILLIALPSFRHLLFPPWDTPTVAFTGSGIEPADPFGPVLTNKEREELMAREMSEGLSDLAAGAAEGQGENPESDVEADVESLVEGDDDPQSSGSTSEKGAAAAKLKNVKVTKVKKLERIGLPIQRTAGNIADLWEQLSNTLSPPPPFPPDTARFALAKPLMAVPILGILFSPGTMVSAISFLAGLAFFGDPLFGLAIQLLDAHAIGWRERIRDRHRLLDSAPTDLQVTIRLLRDAEAASNPLRPPPPLPRRSKSLSTASTSSVDLTKLSDEPAELPTSSRSSLRRRKSTASLVEVQSPLEMGVAEPEPVAAASTSTSSSTFGSKFPLLASKKAASVVLEEPSEGGGEFGPRFQRGWDRITKKATERVRTATAKFDITERLRLREHHLDDASGSPFFAHRSGVPGHLLLFPPTPAKPTWTLSFIRLASLAASHSSSSTTPSPFSNLSVPLPAITSLRKVSSGWRGKVAYDMLKGGGAGGSPGGGRGGIRVEWREEEGEGRGGVETFRGVGKRDELFNRLAGLSAWGFVSA